MDKQLKTNISLAVMMFMQFLLLAVWWVPLAAYLTNTNVSGNLKALILSSMAIGSMASPVIGAFADKYFPAQKILAISNLITAFLLAGAGLSTNFVIVFLFIFLAMICYMPTWSLTSSIAMTHADAEQFPRIRMFGSIGWIASGLFSFVAVKFLDVKTFDGGNLPILCGSGLALIACGLNLTLPNTPSSEKNRKVSVRELLGINAFSLLRDKNYCIFILCTFAAMLSFALYYSFGSEFLQDRQFKYITITMNWGQVVELFFLFFATTLMTRLGLKKALLIGLAALLARYASFYWGSASGTDAYYIIGILFHGLIFGLFFVGGQVYTDKKVPVTLRAQAQGMLSFLIWGVALLLGNFICGKIIGLNTTINEGVKSYNWSIIFAITSIYTALVLVMFLIFFKQDKNEAKQ
jgi:nucleoside transporter